MKRKSIFLLTCMLWLTAGIRAQQDDIELLRAAVARLGRLSFKREVPVKTVSAEEIQQRIDRRFENDYPQQLADMENLFLYLMGFADTFPDIKKTRQRIRTANIGSWYDEKTSELLVLHGWQDSDLFGSQALVHQLRRAVVHQHIGESQSARAAQSDFDDRVLARRAALEGDAMLVTLLFNGFVPDVFAQTYSVDTVMALSPVRNVSALYNLPALYKSLYIMPYINGLQFVHDIYKRKKWRGVNTMLLNPPLSSEQILHPKKYRRGEQPLPVTIETGPDGLASSFSLVVGEYTASLLLSPGDRLIDAAQGWGGDLLHLYTNGNDHFLIWKSLWDSTRDAGRFYYDFKRFVEKRFQVNFRSGRRDGSGFVAGQSDAGYFFLVLNDRTLLYARSNNRTMMNEYINGGEYD